MGSHCWLKSEYTPAQDLANPGLVFKTTQEYGSPSVCRIVGGSFDLRAVSDWVSFLDGFTSGQYRWSIYYANWMKLTTDIGTAFSFGLDVIDGVPTLTQSDTTTLYIPDRWTFAGTKSVPLKVQDPVGYLISNMAAAHPESGISRGYYYRKIGSVKTATSYGITYDLTSAIKNAAVNEIQQEVVENGKV